MSRARVLITCPQMQNSIDGFRDQLEKNGVEIAMPSVVQAPSEEELAATIGGYDGIIAGDDPLTAKVLAAASRLRIISKWGVGIDGIDLDAAREHGIRVTNTPGVFGDAVADVAAGYLVMLARQLHRIDASVRAGEWLKPEGVELRGKTLGILGFGTIGREVARRGHGFGMAPIAYDPMDCSAAADAADVELVTRDELFARSDFAVLCCPLTPETLHLVGARIFGLMKPGGYLVNVARGAIVDETALVDALASGQLAAAALDVFEEEPLPAGHPLRHFEQCVFGSHNSSNTHEGVLRTSEQAVENLLAGLESR